MCRHGNLRFVSLAAQTSETPQTTDYSLIRYHFYQVPCNAGTSKSGYNFRTKHTACPMPMHCICFVISTGDIRCAAQPSQPEIT